MNAFRGRVLAPLALMAAIAIQSHRPLTIELPLGGDKVAHFAAFAALAASWSWALAPLPWSAAGQALTAFAASAGWGGLDELHQAAVPGRFPSFGDAAADAAGAASAAAACAWARVPVRADEPTGSLDSATAEHVLEAFARLVAQGMTIVMVTHDASLAPVFSRQLHLADGSLMPSAAGSGGDEPGRFGG